MQNYTRDYLRVEIAPYDRTPETSDANNSPSRTLTILTRPELFADAISLSDPEPLNGTPVNVNLSMHNAGQTPAGLSTVALYDGDPQNGGALIGETSLALGAGLGEWLDIEGRLDRFGSWLEKRLHLMEKSPAKGFIYASLLFCVGSMAIVGSITDGLKGDPSILVTKAMMDGIISIPFAASMGFGVLGSAVPILIYQGGFNDSGISKKIGSTARAERIAAR